MGKYTERMVEEILNEIFQERRGEFPDTSSSCHLADKPWPREEQEPHVDKRLRYSRFIYVRGTISSFVDEWETMALGLDEQYFKLELLRYLGQPSLQENGGVSQKNRPLDPIEPNEELKIVEIISKRVRTSKYLKDSLYMQTYNLLCDTAEDIVSVIESTSD